jgi:hypothetical protein
VSGGDPGHPGFIVDGMNVKTSQEQRLAAAHASLADAIAKVVTSDDWQQLLRISRSFHRYSPNNQLLLAAQGAEGVVASFNTWKQIPAEDGHPCRIRRGETALRVYAPIRTTRREIDEDTGDEIVERSVVRFKLVPVFHQGQLVSPPDLPVQPKLLVGIEPPEHLWSAVADQVAMAGFTVQRGPLNGLDGAKGVTNYLEHVVTVRDDLAPSQALKTLIHELAHLHMHHPDRRPEGFSRDRMEVEAESVAYVVCDTVGIDAGTYSIPYVANWAGGGTQLVHTTAERVLTSAGSIVAELERRLEVELCPDPLAVARKHLGEEGIEPRAEKVTAVGSTDQLIADHLACGPLNWQRLAGSIPALDHTKYPQFDGNPGAQAVVLAEAGASVEANVAVMRAHKLSDDAIAGLLTVSVPDVNGERPTLYPRDDVLEAIHAPSLVKPLAEDLVSDLIIAAGRRPATAMHLAETSGQPASVVSLVEEKLRRHGHPAMAQAAGGVEPGLTLIDEWVGRVSGAADAQVLLTEPLPPPPGPSVA